MVPTIPLLIAQQQGMSTLVSNLATRSDVATQAAQHTVSNLIKEESKKLDEVESSPLTSSVSDEQENSQEFASQEQKDKREPEEDVETSPSSHNPYAGKLFDTRV